mgnify:CR=1 FL=1
MVWFFELVVANSFKICTFATIYKYQRYTKGG